MTGLAPPTSLKMGVTKADKHCDLGCLFTESPDWKDKNKQNNVGKNKNSLDSVNCVCVCVCLTSESVCV